MQEEPVRPKKRLGQHFLNNPAVARRIVAGLGLEVDDVVLEIGCGTGALTRHLVGRGRYIGVELDPDLCSRLERRYGALGMEFLNRDILTVDLGQLRRRDASPGFRVVGNLPYGISSPVLRHLGRHVDDIDLAVVMLQAEVADRLMAEPGRRDYGVLTLLVRYHFHAERLFAVPRQAFKPRPQVDSKVVRLLPRSHRSLKPCDEHRFFRFVKQAFSQRRKTLMNCLKEMPSVRKERLTARLREFADPKTVRAEQIGPDHFLQLFLSLDAGGAVESPDR